MTTGEFNDYTDLSNPPPPPRRTFLPEQTWGAAPMYTTNFSAEEI
jgi:hypothetical protein